MWRLTINLDVKMEAKECKVQDILTENKKYIIPSYQRPYSWTVDNAEQLIHDIYESSQSEDPPESVKSLCPAFLPEILSGSH